MIIHVGSKNPSKVQAVEAIVGNYDFLKGAQVIGKEVDSGVSGQPLSIEKVILGAETRAKNCFPGARYSFGIEDGLVAVPQTKTGFMNFCVCVIFDGAQTHLGMSSGFEYPLKVNALALLGHEASKAFQMTGLVEHAEIGKELGIIGYLTKGRVDRKQYTIEALRSALIHLENPELYGLD